MSNTKKNTPIHLQPYMMWLLPLSFFAIQFILRLWPSLMMQPIMKQFQIDATGFGLLASTYYYGYAGAQIPMALCLDRFGVRNVLFVCTFICSLATLAFCMMDMWVLALTSRFLIGVGSAAGFLATSHIITQWFPKQHYGRMIGFSFSLGLLGAIYGGKPTGLLVEQWGGQTVAIFLSALCLLLGVLAYVFLKEPKTAKPKQTAQANQDLKDKTFFSLQDLKRVFTSPTLVILGIANLLMVGILEGFADVWGVNYLMAAYDIPKVEAAQLVSFIFVGMLFGGPILAFFSRYLGSYHVIAFCGIGIAALLSYLILATPSFHTLLLITLFFVAGIFCCYQVLVFTAATHIMPPYLLGVSIAFLNCINMLGGSFFHSLIGYIMDLTWDGKIDASIRVYHIKSYSYALLSIPICAIIASIMVWIIHITRKRKEI